MRKRVILALMLIVSLAVTSSCGIIVKDEEVDKQTVIVEVAGKTITKGEVNGVVSSYLDYMEMMYQSYGLPYDKTDPAVVAEMRQDMVNTLIEETVVDDKQNQLGFQTYTEEEMAEMEATAEETYQGYLDTVKTSNFEETELTGEELDAAVAEKAVELGYSTKEQLLVNEKSNLSYDKLKADVVKDVTVTDEEVQTAYDEKVAAAKEEYEATPTAYGTAVGNGQTVYYVPSGYRYVKNLLRNLEEEDSTAISELSAELAGKKDELNVLEPAAGLSVEGEEVEPAEEDAAVSAEKEQTITTLKNDIADLERRLDETTEAAYGKIQPTIEEILQKLADGADFDALIEEYGEDPGMTVSPAKEQGYLIGEGDTTYVAEFTEASLALAKVGDVSPAVRTSYGIHLIQYASDLAEGAVPLEDVKEALHDELLTTKQDELYTSTVAQWIEEANAKVYMDRLD